MKQRQPNTSAMEKANGTAPSGVEESLRKRIAIRAYELFRDRGSEHGHAEDDWHEAERQIKTEMQQSRSARVEADPYDGLSGHCYMIREETR